MKKIFYDNGKWWAFVPPVKPHEFIDEIEQYDIWQDYEKAYTEAKANALEVGNPRDFQDEDFKTSMLLVDGKPFLADGQEYDWKGSAVIKDGKYILSI